MAGGGGFHLVTIPAGAQDLELTITDTVASVETTRLEFRADGVGQFDFEDICFHQSGEISLIFLYIQLPCIHNHNTKYVVCVCVCVCV